MLPTSPYLSSPLVSKPHISGPSTGRAALEEGCAAHDGMPESGKPARKGHNGNPQWWPGLLIALKNTERPKSIIETFHITQRPLHAVDRVNPAQSKTRIRMICSSKLSLRQALKMLHAHQVTLQKLQTCSGSTTSRSVSTVDMTVHHTSHQDITKPTQRLLLAVTSIVGSIIIQP